MSSEQPLYGRHVHVCAQRAATDRRYWSCIMGAMHNDLTGRAACDFAADWYAVCDDFGNLVQVKRDFLATPQPC